ncbi:hypothetical protein POX_e06509 [Penicillium oxalicum]|uniref:Ubiquitin-like domain-containing protein n=1 Tax=Penicillium oxalicum (strain 114-2 / CGMCC 5302) TaxID=933388 RepID=S7ZBC1_PENO1|nr:hypothetical protein POX_e06509 [Penicillium oxalicum]EPS27544.1 hypothetical protein PDE_02487 [Penicillium oxalicum 114-2]KAI2788493.1 hypothetical protein POX_e06509 [Penicillium oxalicum]
MRSFFQKPEWATKTGDSSTEFYRRSGQTFSDIVAANREARRKQKLAALSSQSRSPDPLDQSREAKRRRKSDENEVISPTEDEKSAGQDEGDGELESAHEDDDRGRTASSQPDDNEDEEEGKSRHDANSFQTSDGISQPTSPPRPIYIDDSPRKQPADEPLNQSLSHQDMNIEHTSAPQSTTRQERTDDGRLNLPAQSTTTTGYTSPLPRATPTPPPAVKDIRVHILITSNIPNTKPLIVQRKITQALRDARLAWCERQGFTDQEKSTIYLTWQGRRVFDVTTCGSLNIKNDKKSLLSIDDEFDEEEPPSELQIHMEAVTQNQTLLNRRGPSPDVSGRGASDADAGDVPPDTQNDPDNAPMKLMLKSPGLSDFKIKARPSTKVSKIVAAFRQKQNISEGKLVHLVFDGDRLEPDQCLSEYDVSDLDMLEVLIK